MQSNTLYLLMFGVNLAFIVTSIYGWLLKRFYVTTAYKEHYSELYPLSHTMGNMFLIQLFELPYLFMIGDPEALFYVNGTALLFFTSYLVILVRGYFFLHYYSLRKIFFFMIPVLLCWLLLLLQTFGIITFTPTCKIIVAVIIMAVFIGYIYMLDRTRLNLVYYIREIEEDEFSNDTDFSIKFAESIKWLPLTVCILLVVNFIIDDPLMKMFRDIFFTVLNVWFSIKTLNPHRNLNKIPLELKKKDEGEETGASVKYRLTEKYCMETQKKLIGLIEDNKMYLEEHLTMNDLTEIMHTNKNYLSEVIARSEYKSFYRLINTMRIEYACELLRNNPSSKLEQIALESGFSSGSAFSQVFKRLKDISPKDYIAQIHAE